MTLRLIEYVALLQVMSILYISVCLPVRWLSGNTEELAKWDFGVLDMGKVCDMLEEAMIEIEATG